MTYHIDYLVHPYASTTAAAIRNRWEDYQEQCLLELGYTIYDLDEVSIQVLDTVYTLAVAMTSAYFGISTDTIDDALADS